MTETEQVKQIVEDYANGKIGRVAFIRQMEQHGYTVEKCRAMLRDIDREITKW